ncbi:MAG: hypothetical protein IJ735_06960, partial [Clostridia bacterium]|nr:hypothetical protein [Clostridia bacterium]
MSKGGVINDIMSAKAPVLVMPSASYGGSVGFLSDLVNFYRYTYWLCCDYDEMTSFSMTFAKKVLGKGEEYLRLKQFKHCEFEYEKDNIIIGKVLEKIAANNADTLLVIDGLECVNNKTFDSQLEFLLKKCPKNLKIVLVSKRFVDLNYNNLDVCPKVIEPEEEAAAPTVTLTMKDRGILSEVSVLGHADGSFCSELFPEARSTLDSLAKSCPSLVMKKGADLYCFTPGVFEAPEEKAKEVKKKFALHLLRTDRAIAALDIAVKNGFFDLVDLIVDEILRVGDESYALVEYLRFSGDRGFEEEYAVTPQRKIIFAIKRGFRKDFRRMTALADEIVSSSDKNSFLERMGHEIKYLAYTFSGQYRVAVEYARTILHERVREEKSAYLWTDILCRLPEAIKKCEGEVIESDFLLYESQFESE